MRMDNWVTHGFFDLNAANQELVVIAANGWFWGNATSTGMVIDNHHIATIGWFMSDSETKVPDGEEIYTGGWLDGTIAAPVSTAGGKIGKMARFRLFMPFWKRRT